MKKADGSYEIREDADDGRIYIGFDSSMNMVTPMYVKA